MLRSHSGAGAIPAPLAGLPTDGLSGVGRSSSQQSLKRFFRVLSTDDLSEGGDDDSDTSSIGSNRSSLGRNFARRAAAAGGLWNLPLRSSSSDALPPLRCLPEHARDLGRVLLAIKGDVAEILDSNDALDPSVAWQRRDLREGLRLLRVKLCAHFEVMESVVFPWIGRRTAVPPKLHASHTRVVRAFNEADAALALPPVSCAEDESPVVPAALAPAVSDGASAALPAAEGTTSTASSVAGGDRDADAANGRDSATPRASPPAGVDSSLATPASASASQAAVATPGGGAGSGSSSSDTRAGAGPGTGAGAAEGFASPCLCPPISGMQALVRSACSAAAESITAEAEVVLTALDAHFTPKECSGELKPRFWCAWVRALAAASGAGTAAAASACGGAASGPGSARHGGGSGDAALVATGDSLAALLLSPAAAAAAPLDAHPHASSGLSPGSSAATITMTTLTLTSPPTLPSASPVTPALTASVSPDGSTAPSAATLLPPPQLSGTASREQSYGAAATAAAGNSPEGAAASSTGPVRGRSRGLSAAAFGLCMGGSATAVMETQSLSQSAPASDRSVEPVAGSESGLPSAASTVGIGGGTVSSSGLLLPSSARGSVAPSPMLTSLAGQGQGQGQPLGLGQGRPPIPAAFTQGHVAAAASASAASALATPTLGPLPGPAVVTSATSATSAPSSAVPALPLSSSGSGSIVGVGSLAAALGELLSWLAHQCPPGSEEEDAAVGSVLHTLLGVGGAGAGAEGAPEPRLSLSARAPAGAAMGVSGSLPLPFGTASAGGAGSGSASAPSTARFGAGSSGPGGPSGPSGVGIVLAAGGLTLSSALARYAGEWRPLWARTFQAPLRRVLSALFAEGASEP